MTAISQKDFDAIEREINVINERLFELGCDSVQVVATAIVREGQGTVAFAKGTGNVYARRGAVKDWLDSQAGSTLAEEIAQALE